MLKSIHKSGINFEMNLQTFISQTHSDRMSESDYYIVANTWAILSPHILPNYPLIIRAQLFKASLA